MSWSPPQDAEQRISVFLLSDIDNFAVRREQRPDLMRLAQSRHEAVMLTVAEAHSGRMSKPVGSALCVVFADAEDAVLAAVTARRALAVEAFNSGGGVRIAVHLSEAAAPSDGISDRALDRAGRLLSIVHGGQIVASEAVARRLDEMQTDQWTLIDLGHHRLKDLIHTEHVFEVTAAGLLSEFPALSSLNSVPNNLPQQITSFVGRMPELATLKTQIERHRLVTLLGFGGIGKTRMALQAGAELASSFPDGVWLVDLAPLMDPALVAEQVCTLLGIGDPGSVPAMDRAVTFLRQKNLLLILDSCEHLVPAAAQLSSVILRNCPNIRVLATSRAPLEVSGERRFRIRTLGMPPQNDRITAAEALRYGAVQLFVDRASLLLQGYALVDADAPAVTAICRRLDGIALAIELAAPRLQMLKPAELLIRLNHRFRLLTSKGRTGPARQHTLLATIDWSFNLLSEAEKALFRRVSVFGGGWTLDAATAIASDELVQDYAVFDLLASLVDKSLVVTSEAGSGEQRYHLLESLRDYAGSKLIEAGEQAWPRRLATYLASELRRATAEYETTATVRWLSIYAPEIDNLRAALDWAFGPTGDAALGLTLTAFGASVWFGLALGSEHRRRIEFAATRIDGETDPSVAARIYRLRGVSTQAGGALGLDDARRAVAMARSLDEPLFLIRSLITLAAGLMSQGNFAEADMLLQEGREIARPFNRTKVVASLFNASGNLAYLMGDVEIARDHYQKSLSIARSIADQQGIDSASQNIAELLFATGERDAAIVAARQALIRSRMVGNRETECFIASNLAAYLLLTDELAEGTELAAHALKEAPSFGEHGLATWAVQHLAFAATKGGDTEHAAQLQGFVDAFYAAQQATRQPTEQATSDLTLAALTSALPDEDRDRLMQQGSMMTLDRIRELALSKLSLSDPGIGARLRPTSPRSSPP